MLRFCNLSKYLWHHRSTIYDSSVEDPNRHRLRDTVWKGNPCIKCQVARWGANSTSKGWPWVFGGRWIRMWVDTSTTFTKRPGGGPPTTPPGLPARPSSPLTHSTRTPYHPSRPSLRPAPRSFSLPPSLICPDTGGLACSVAVWVFFGGEP